MNRFIDGDNANTPDDEIETVTLEPIYSTTISHDYDDNDDDATSKCRNTRTMTALNKMVYPRYILHCNFSIENHFVFTAEIRLFGFVFLGVFFHYLSHLF